ncbi:MAG: glutamate--tRNA ligase family protein [Oligoflexia bacterium]|nr:glutamate--tRNA ligase family protein [Oligoflexia bacterium]
MSGIRFAPSPTGRFHLGNLRTAWISWRWARALGEPWVLRFEDIDRPRVAPGARELQLADLRRLGLESRAGDERHLQSEREERHWELLLRAWHEGRVYPCSCSRKEVLDDLRTAASAPHGEPPLYGGRCREPSRRPVPTHPTLAWRFRGEDPGGARDFIVARSAARPGSKRELEGPPDRGSFAPAYHWACAIDDHDGGYALLVRAWDLAHAVPHQRAIHEWVCASTGSGNPYPAVFHTSLLTSDSGGRLEKRTRGVTLPELEAAGLSPSEILERFERSFELDAASYSPGKIWGEARETITLGELGFGRC